MPIDIPVPQSGGGGGGGGIPTRYLVVGAGAAGLALLLFLQRNKQATPAPPAGYDPVYGAALGPNAALALGDLQTRVLQESGLLQEQLRDYFQAASEQLGDVEGGIYSAVSGAQKSLSQQLDVSTRLLAAQGWQAEQLQRYFATRQDYLAGRISEEEWQDWQRREEERYRRDLAPHFWPGDIPLPSGIP